MQHRAPQPVVLEHHHRIAGLEFRQHRIQPRAAGKTPRYAMILKNGIASGGFQPVALHPQPLVFGGHAGIADLAAWRLDHRPKAHATTPCPQTNLSGQAA